MSYHDEVIPLDDIMRHYFDDAFHYRSPRVSNTLNQRETLTARKDRHT